jgi:hypothetical protein
MKRGKAYTHPEKPCEVENVLPTANVDAPVDACNEAGEIGRDGHEERECGAPVSSACVAIASVRAVHCRNVDVGMVDEVILRAALCVSAEV